MNWFILLGAAGLVGGLVGLWLTGKIGSKDSAYVSTVEIVAGIVCVLVMMGGFLQLISAATEGRQQPEGVSAVVAGVAQNPDGTTTLTVQVGEEETQYEIDCLPEQKGCQSAQRGDIVQYDRTTHPSGWTAHREVRFITRGANSP